MGIKKHIDRRRRINKGEQVGRSPDNRGGWKGKSTQEKVNSHLNLTPEEILEILKLEAIAAEENKKTNPEFKN